MDATRPLFLEQFHQAQGAKFAPFAGWNMPLQYTGIIAEHIAVRERCGLFDVSHMGEIMVSGKDALAFLQYVTCNDVAKLVPGAAQYSAMLNEKGGVIDDIIIYLLAQEKFMLCVNASNRSEASAWLLSQKKDFTVVIQDISDEYCLIALQGKTAIELARKLLPSVPRKRFAVIEEQNLIVARTGYTGEAGVEIFVPNGLAKGLLEKIMALGPEFGLSLCGLAARDSLRLEAAYPLHGHELSPDVRADECGLSWIIKFAKGDFIGKQALQSSEPQHELVGLTMLEPGIARQDAVIYDPSGTVVGIVTSGTKTPSVLSSIALARIQKNDGRRFMVEVRGKKLLCEKCDLPFYKG